MKFWQFIFLLALVAISIVATKPVKNSLAFPERQDIRIVVISDLNSQYGSTEYEPS